MLTIQNVNVYDLVPSVLASGYAMRTNPLEKPLDSYTEDSEIFVDIYAEILNVDYGDLENSLKSAGNTRGILYKISDRHRAASKNVNIFNIQANVLVEDKKIP